MAACSASGTNKSQRVGESAQPSASADDQSQSSHDKSTLVNAANQSATAKTTVNPKLPAMESPKPAPAITTSVATPSSSASLGLVDSANWDYSNDNGYKNNSFNDDFEDGPSLASVPYNLNIDAGETELEASWSSSGSNTLGFLVRIYLGSQSSPSCLGGYDTGVSKRTTFYNLDPDTRYTIAVCAYDENYYVTQSIYSYVTTNEHVDPPSPPNNLHFSEVTSTSLTLNWDWNDSSVTNAFLAITEGSSAVHCDSGITASESQATFTDLRPKTLYTVSICNHNAGGFSDGVAVSATTLAPKAESPLFLKATLTSYNHVSVSWESGGDDTDGFYVSIKSDTTTACSQGQDVGKQTSADFSDLEEATDYTILVCAYNSDKDFGGTSTVKVSTNVSRDTLNGLYQRYLGRDIDDAGYQYYYARVAAVGLSAASLEIASSRESINKLYVNYLGQAVDDAGFQYWHDRVVAVGYLQASTEIATTRESVTNAYLEVIGRLPSEGEIIRDAVSAQGSLVGWLNSFPSVRAEGITNAYRTVLGRNPSQQELQRDGSNNYKSELGWLNSFDTVRAEGIKLAYAVVLGRQPTADELKRDAANNYQSMLTVLNSYKEVQQAGLTKAFQEVLRRNPTPEELNYYAANNYSEQYAYLMQFTAVRAEGITRAYLTVMGRAPNAAELQRDGANNFTTQWNWLNSFVDVRAAGITQAYRAVLGRSPTTGELQRDGANNYATEWNWLNSFADVRAAGIKAAYREVLGREPTKTELQRDGANSYASQYSWLNSFAAVRAEGIKAAYRQVMGRLPTDAELVRDASNNYKSQYGWLNSYPVVREAGVKKAFVDALGREPSAAELQTYASFNYASTYAAITEH